MSARIRVVACVASVISLLMLVARSEAAFELHVTVSQGGETASFTTVDNQFGDIAIAQEGYLIVNQMISLNSGATLNFNTTVGTSKPNTPNGLTVRHMSLSTTTVQVTGAETSPVTVLLELVDTGFAPLNPYAPTAALENTFTFNPLQTSATGSFQSFVGLDDQDLQKFHDSIGAYETDVVQIASGLVSADHRSKEIDSPSAEFSLIQVATIQFNGNGMVQLTGQTQVHTPEPATAILWSALGLMGFGAAVIRQRRRQRSL
jgi:hypothetical protein